MADETETDRAGSEQADQAQFNRTLIRVMTVQVLALMLERKRVLRPKGSTADGRRLVYEHAKSKELYEVPAAELSPEFFLSIQDQLAALVGGGKSKAEQPAAQPTDDAESAEGGKTDGVQA